MTTPNAVVPQAVFGPGLVRLTPAVTNPTPYDVGFVNDFSLDMKRDFKELFGTNTFPLAVGAGTTKVTGKVKAATLSAETFNNIFFGGTFTAGTQWDIAESASTPIPATPFHITPSPPNSGTWQYDLGVINSATGEPFTEVANSPTAGQYSYAAGVYTFASADNVSGISVNIFFAYSWTSGAAGQNIVIPNQMIGASPIFQLDYKSVYAGQIYMLTLYNGVCTGINMAHKLSDFMMPEIDMSFFVNAAGNLGRMSVATLA